MKLQEIFDQLRSGEFSQLSIGGQGAGEINEGNYRQVISHINLALTTLYRRFNLKEGRIGMTLTPGRTVYPVTSSFAVANTRSKEVVRYLEDSAEAPFKDDIHKILRVLTEFGQDMPLNDAAECHSCLTPTMTTLVVPDIVANQTNKTPFWLRIARLTLVYRANHPAIVVPLGLFDPNRVTIELPPSHLEALLYYVASRVHNPIGMSNEFHAGNNYAAKFEASCVALENAGIQVDQVATNWKLHQRGFA